MNEETTKKEFLDGYEIWLAPSNDVEGKEMIPLLLLGTQEAGTMNFVVNNATSITSYVSNEIKRYFKKAHILPILDPEKMFRGVGDKDLKLIFVGSVLTSSIPRFHLKIIKRSGVIKNMNQ